MTMPDDKNLPAWLKPQSASSPVLDMLGDNAQSTTEVRTAEKPASGETTFGLIDDMAIPSRPQDEVVPSTEQQVEVVAQRRGVFNRLAGVFQVIFIFCIMLAASLIAGFLFGYLGLGF